MNIESEILTTKSVNSTVPVNEGDKGDDDRFGNGDAHICLLDYDDSHLKAVKGRVSDAPGINVVLQSSEDSYHVWNLSVDDLKTTACRQVLLRDDYPHIRNGIQGGYWRLRIGPKMFANMDKEEYKPRPQLETIWVNGADYAQSEPHIRLAEGLFDVDLSPVIDRYNFKLVGNGDTSHDEYYSITDKLKDKWNKEMDNGE